MPRKKGDGLGRIGGRSKGTPNKVTTTAKQWITDLVNKNRKQFEKDLKELEPLERVKILERLLAYVVPKQQAINTALSIERMTEAQLSEMAEVLLNNLNEQEK